MCLTFANLKIFGSLLKDIERLQISVTGLTRTRHHLLHIFQEACKCQQPLWCRYLSKSLVYNLFLLVVNQIFYSALNNCSIDLLRAHYICLKNWKVYYREFQPISKNKL